MRSDHKEIPINSMTDDYRHGIAMERISFKKNDFTQAHRDEGHTFHILEKGRVHIEIDFQKYEINAPAVVYMHPDQVHRILDFEDITICSLSVKDENLNSGYLTLLEDITPSKPLHPDKENNRLISEVFAVCLNFYVQDNNRLHYPLLKDSCNTLVGFLLSQFLDQNRTDSHPTRFEIITKAFKGLLEKNYRRSKRPLEYADKLNISTSYLNECVKNTTGFPVSKHIQDRIILEAKRLLYHSDKSVKEISFHLGYDDYPYFSRTFTKATGMSALTFRNKNRD